MKLNQLYVATLIATLPATSIFAAALERSNQSVSAFLESGNYFEAGFDVTDQNISGKTTNNLVGQLGVTGANSNIDLGNAINDTYLVPKMALKIQATDKLSVGLIYDEPFGIDTIYSEAPRYLASATAGSTDINIETQNLTLLLGYQPTDNWTVYAGPIYQTLQANISPRGQHTTGFIYNTAGVWGNYIGSIDKDEAFGWLAGFSYQTPSKKIRTSLTYRSEIKHKFQAEETGVTTFIPNSGTPYQTIYNAAIANKSSLTTPQSVNANFSYNFQTNSIATVDLRWVNWKNFNLYLPYYRAKVLQSIPVPNTTSNTLHSKDSYNPIAYNKDQWSIDLGLAQKLSDKWQINGSLGWDSGVGEYISHYTPINGSWSAGVGVQFSPASNYFVQTGIKYIWLDDVKGQHAKQVSENSNLHDTEFNNIHALSYNFKIGYRF